MICARGWNLGLRGIAKGSDKVAYQAFIQVVWQEGVSLLEIL